MARGWQFIATFFAQGHLLIEGNPGTAKTLIAKVLAKLTGLQMARIQGTPDLMPNDIIGSIVPNSDELEWINGPILEGNIVFIDEINRMNPRTQSVTLQAMQEGKVTYWRKSRPLFDPNMFIATMNPIEQEGTFPLPEAQLDRFTVKVRMPTPDRATIRRILERFRDRHATEHMVQELKVLEEWSFEGGGEKVLNELKKTLDMVALGEAETWIPNLIEQISPRRPKEAPLPKDSVRHDVRYGGSPRGAQALLQLASVRALLDERGQIQRSDLEHVRVEALQHRIQLAHGVTYGEAKVTKTDFLEKLKLDL